MRASRKGLQNERAPPPSNTGGPQEAAGAEAQGSEVALTAAAASEVGPGLAFQKGAPGEAQPPSPSRALRPECPRLPDHLG